MQTCFFPPNYHQQPATILTLSFCSLPFPSLSPNNFLQPIPLVFLCWCLFGALRKLSHLQYMKQRAHVYSFVLCFQKGIEKWLKHPGGSVISWWFNPSSHLLVITTHLFFFLFIYFFLCLQCVIKLNISTVVCFCTSTVSQSLLWEGNLLGNIPVDVWECSLTLSALAMYTHVHIHTHKLSFL